MTKQIRSAGPGSLLLLLAAAVVLGSSGVSAQGVDKFVVTGDAAKKALSKSEISGATAAKIAQTCEDFATQHNIAVSIFILSPSGSIVHAHRMDGQSPLSIDTALDKARSALYTRTATHELANRTHDDLGGQVRYYTRLNAFPVSGGLPIIVDNELIGAIGVGGSNMDEECANAALTAVLGQQPPLAPKMPASLAPSPR
jgi:glc operon protein GlcG